MKFHFIAEDILSSRGKIKTLKMLLRYPAKSFSGRELARLLDLSPSCVLSALELFRRYGLAHKTKTGKTSLWRLNKSHLLARKLSALAGLDEKFRRFLRQKIKSAFAKEKKVVQAAVFGSVAKGEEKPESDIDLFVLIKENKHKKAAETIVDKLNETMIPQLGNAISSIIYSSGELRNKKNSELIKHIEKEGLSIFHR